MFFDIRVHLPPGTAQQPQRITNLESNIGNFAHVLGDLADSVQFDSISLKGANEPIQAKVCAPPCSPGTLLTKDPQSLSADVAQIRTSNALIEGHYLTPNKLTLTTANGNIDAEVTLTNAGGRATSVELGSSNGCAPPLSLSANADAPTGR